MNSQTLITFSKSTSYLVIFVLFPLLHRLPCTSSKQELGVCESPFQCGEISAGFPFWGGNRPENCGLPLLELHCRNISRYIFNHLRPRVLCSQTLPSDIFEILPAYKELEVYYLCDRRYFSKQNYTSST
uniref:Wall-associated receptor kinase galacturonan-binding domain-containing protein n=1 Tax=Brassica oleracea TaxID=3712 RepID=A0A3P6H5B0_BRAOL|nr:unnamed protein product [Brassica oleracea]